MGRAPRRRVNLFLVAVVGLVAVAGAVHLAAGRAVASTTSRLEPNDAQGARSLQTPPARIAADTAPTPTPTASPTPSPPLDNAAPAALRSDIEQLVASSGRRVGVRLVDLGGPAPADLAINADDVFTAGSTYKLVALADEAQRIATGQVSPSHTVCYQADDYEAGWFDDYQDGSCFSLQELGERAGVYSDNTAGHMLVRDLGGGDALNAFAAAAGARSAQLYDPNLVTADDLAAVLVAEASGRLGGQAAQQWLYPLLSNTVESAGIPAGVPQGTQVMHKTGWYDTVENDAALVVGPQGGYVLVICSDGDASDAGWQLLASISARVWQYESQRLP